MFSWLPLTRGFLKCTFLKCTSLQRPLPSPERPLSKPRKLAAFGARRRAAGLVSPRNAAASSPEHSRRAPKTHGVPRLPAASGRREAPGMLPLQAQKTHSLPRQLPLIWARLEFSGQAVSVLGLELQHFGARPAGPPGRAPPARRPGVLSRPERCWFLWAW